MLRSIRKNKRGDVTEFILILVILFFIAVSFLVVAYVTDVFEDTIDETALNNTAVAQSAKSQLSNMSSNTIQRGFVIFFVFIVIGMMILSFLIRIHPVFIFLYIIFLAISIFLSIFLSNAYEQLVNTGALALVASKQTMTNWIWSNIVIIELAVGAMSMIITFAKIMGGSNETRF